MKMTSVQLKIKHAKGSYDVTIDTAKKGSDLKEEIYKVTGVPVAMQKVPVKGGLLKDDTDLSKLGLKPNQLIQVIGTAGPIPKAPEGKIVFAEDMTEAELATHSLPSGLINEGNTCYMASTVQVMRAIAPLQEALTPQNVRAAADPNQAANAPSAAATQTAKDLTTSLSFLYAGMNGSTDPYAPTFFLPALRRFNPQFDETTASEMHPGHRHHQQQDAEECWSSLLTALRDTVKVGGQSFVEKYLTGEMTSVKKIAEANVEEEPTYSTESFQSIKCNINQNTNYLSNGIREPLDEQFEKTSPTLNRLAVYDEKKRISRLPTFLTVHVVRFAWRREINKKAKIMRRVQFPLEFDAIDLLTDELKARVAPINNRFKEIEKDRRQRANIRSRSRAKRAEEEREKKKREAEARMRGDAAAAASSSTAEAETAAGDEMVVDEEDEDAKEVSLRKKEEDELNALCDKDIQAEAGACVSAMYELVGVVTHKGASADGGHYVGWVKKDALVRPGVKTEAEKPKVSTAANLEKEQWYRFDDERVTVVDGAKILTLGGGGEDHAAYILLYKEKTFA